MSDAQNFSNFELFNSLEDDSIGLQPFCPLTVNLDDSVEMPLFYIPGDDAFALWNYLMKPYSRRCICGEDTIFN